MPARDAEAVPLRNRLIMEIQVGPDDYLAIEHVYAPDGAVSRDECHGPAHDAGRVALTLMEGEDAFSVLLSPETALLVANRLTRAANLALESLEDGPDLEREVARFALDVPPQRDS